MMLYKEKVEQYKEDNKALEKEKEEILTFKSPIHQQDPAFTIENIAKAMSNLSLKEWEIQKLKENLGEKDTKITSLKER